MVFSGSAQVGIGVSGTVDASARFQIDANASTNAKGFLPPRVALTSTATASNAISSPATGLLVYNTATAGSGSTAVTPGFYYYSGSAWERLDVAVAKSIVIAQKQGSGEKIIPGLIFKVSGWSETTDVNGDFDPVSGEFTARRAGNYLFVFSYKFEIASTGGNTKIEAFMSCSTASKEKKTALGFPSSGDAAVGAQSSFVVNLAAGEKLWASIYHNTTSDKYLWDDNDDFTNLSIVEL